MAAPISHVNVISVGESLLVTWRGGDERVSVFVSDNPDDAGVEVFAPDLAGRAMVPASSSGRSFVHLFDPDSGFKVAAERHLEMDGPLNFRDLGGYPSQLGGVTGWGRVFRSDRLDSTSEIDRQRMSDLGITEIFDLRADAEVANAPDELPAGVESVHLPMSSDGAQARTIMERIDAGDLTGYSPRQMSDGYLVMLDEFTAHFRRIIESVADQRTVLFHCTAGKDRTGVVAMVLLSICGVPDGYILDDYELTNSYRPAFAEHFAAVIESKGLDPAEFSTLWSAPRPVMRSVLDGIDTRWGGIDGFLEHAGIDATTVEAVRHRLLVDHRP